MSRTATIAAPVRGASGSRRYFPARRLHTDSLAEVSTVAYWLRCARHRAPAQHGSCRQCGRRLRPLQGEREWGLAFCRTACVDDFGRRHNRTPDRSAA